MKLFQNTHPLANILQSKQLDIARAIEFAEKTSSNLVSIKTDMDSCDAFNELYFSCEKICISNNIEVPKEEVSKGKRKRLSENNIVLKLNDSYKINYDKIIDIYVQEIQERFQRSNLKPVLELFKLIMIENEKTEVDFDSLKIYSHLYLN